MMCKPIGRFLFLLLFLQIIISHSAYAAPVGEFTSVVGSVTQARAKEVLRPVVKSSIELKDLIATDRASSTSMVFSDSSTIMLSENTKMEIEEFLFKETSRRGIFSLMTGKLTVNVNMKKYIEGANVFEVRSLTALVGVRGTGFEFVEAIKESYIGSTLVKQGMATVSCTEGSLNLSAFSPTGVVVSTAVLEAGQMAVIIGGVITISVIGAVAVAGAVSRAAEAGAAGAAGGAGTGTGGTAAASAGTAATSTGTVAAGTAAGTTAAGAATTGLSTATITGLALGGAAVVGGVATAGGGGGGGGASSSGGGGAGGSPSQTIFNIGTAVPQDCTNLNSVSAGQAIIFQTGVGRWSTPEEAQRALVGQYAVITLDGSPLNVFYKGIEWNDYGGGGYGDQARANWVATTGTHTATGRWTTNPTVFSCTFTISR